jgi:RNA polymerase sigma factor (TIGR02999 family)
MKETELRALAQSADSGNNDDRERLFAALYSELHRIAQRELRRSTTATISPTTLLHETFLNLPRQGAPGPERARFMAYAGCAMRGLLIEYLRTRQAHERSGKFEITSLPIEFQPGTANIEAQKLGNALDELSLTHPRLAECVDLKFFCGLSYAQIARLWDVSERSVQREWEKARIELHRLLSDKPVP